MRPVLRALLLSACLAGLVVGGCTDDDPAPEVAAAPTSSPTATVAAVPSDDELRTELLQMMADDQAERTGAGLPPGTKLPPPRDHQRAQRLRDVVEMRGWPTHDEVGEQGGTAAWLVAQHADFDVAYQQWAPGELTAAVRAGQADRTEAAYLADRVAVNTGVPQVYGSQVRCRDGEPQPATPLKRPDDIESLRHRVGMDPLATYYGELAMMCAQEAAAGQEAGPG